MRLDNRESYAVSDIPLQMELNFCCACYKHLQMNSAVVECPNCFVARYCTKQCSDAAKTVHNPVCKSILAANKETVDCDELRNLSNTLRPAKEGNLNRAGLSLCVVIALTGLQSGYANFRYACTVRNICLLVFPQQNLWTCFDSSIVHYFTLAYGSHLPDYMMDMKAACILANLESESRTVTVYTHRIFPLEKVPDAFSLVERSLHLCAQLDFDRYRTNDDVRGKKRRSKKGKQRFR